MKNLLFSLFIVAGLLLAGCSDLGTNSSVPESVDVQKSSTSEWDLIPLPEKTSTEKLSAAVGFINGDKGGKIKLHSSYWTRSGKVKVKATLDIPAGAFDGWKFILYMVDDKSAVVDFYPSMEFDKELEFDLSFEGIDLKGINPAAVAFAYLDAHFSVQLVSYDKINVDVENGELEVKGAKISHFSRYGFIK